MQDTKPRIANRDALFTPLLHGRSQILPCLFACNDSLRAPKTASIAGSRSFKVDIVYVVVIFAFLLATLGLVAGCAALERKK